MKHKLIISGVVGLAAIVGGVVGVSAYSDPSTVQAQNQKLESKTNFITIEQATEIAVNKSGGWIESIELEKDDGVYKYEIELETKRDDDIEVEVDATTGDIIRYEADDIDDNWDDENHSSQTSKMVISRDEAIAIAQKDTPGTVIEVEFDDGHYEVEVKDGRKKVEYEISARTGTILEKDVDFD